MRLNIIICAFAASAAVAMPARAENIQLANAQADACSKGLPAESKLIYDATVQNLGSAPTIREVVEKQTKSLVMSGKVGMGSARSSAMTAAKCIEIFAKG
jgi:hypothetical protein